MAASSLHIRNAVFPCTHRSEMPDWLSQTAGMLVRPAFVPEPGGELFHERDWEVFPERDGKQHSKQGDGIFSESEELPSEDDEQGFFTDEEEELLEEINNELSVGRETAEVEQEFVEEPKEESSDQENILAKVDEESLVEKDSLTDDSGKAPKIEDVNVLASVQEEVPPTDEKQKHIPNDEKDSSTYPKKQPLTEEIQARIIEEVAQGVAALEAEARARGQAEGEAAGKAAYSEAIERLGQIMADLVQAQQQELATMEGQMIDLAIVVTRTLLGRELKSDEEYALRLLKEAIDLIADGSEIDVTVSPADYEKITELAVKVGQEHPKAGKLFVRKSEKISAGCIVETRVARVDATIEARLQNVLEALHAGAKT
ncbi:MAG: FliH/SctL family protein [Pseudomonadota bacterium]